MKNENEVNAGQAGAGGVDGQGREAARPAVRVPLFRMRVERNRKKEDRNGYAKHRGL